MGNRVIVFLLTFFGSLGFGLLFIVLFVNSTEVACMRQPSGSYLCEIRTLFLGKYPTRQHSIQDVTGIHMASTHDSDGTSYRAEFSTANGDSVPLSEVWTDYGPVSRQVSEIGSQMDSGTDPVTYTAQPLWWVLYLIGGLALIGVFSSFFTLRR